MLFSPVLAIAGTMKTGFAFLGAYVVYIGVTRFLLAMVLSTYARRVDLNFIWALYTNQLLNAIVKVYMTWRLAKQKWTNRGNQKQGFAGSSWLSAFREGMAFYLTALSFSALFIVVMIYTKLLSVPSLTMMFSILKM